MGKVGCLWRRAVSGGSIWEREAALTSFFAHTHCSSVGKHLYLPYCQHLQRLQRKTAFRAWPRRRLYQFFLGLRHQYLAWAYLFKDTHSLKTLLTHSYTFTQGFLDSIQILTLIFLDLQNRFIKKKKHSLPTLDLCHWRLLSWDSLAEQHPLQTNTAVYSF